MPGKPPLGEDALYTVATYLAQPDVRAELHAELPERHRAQFETEYAEATREHPLPTEQRGGSYYVWGDDTNKFGRELRIYFVRVAPEPPLIRGLYTDHGKWHGRSDRYRINHSDLVMQLFECGFVLGDNSANQDRIDEFMRRRFPVVTDDD